MARRYCRTRGIRFTTSFHTRFPEYLNQRFAIPTGWTAAVLRRFHNAGAGLMVATPSLGRELEAQGFERVLPWTRGVDTDLFRPRPVRLFGDGAGVPLRRPHRGGEEHRRVPRPRPARPQGGRRRRPAARRADGEISATCCSPASGPARRWPSATLRPTCSCSPAAPTPSAWCCWKRWRRGCRSRRCPCAGRRTW